MILRQGVTVCRLRGVTGSCVEDCRKLIRGRWRVGTGKGWRPRGHSSESGGAVGVERAGCVGDVEVELAGFSD